MTAWPLAAVGAVLVAIAVAARTRRRFVIVTVEGDSMRPALCPGQRIVVRRRAHPRSGDVVLIERPGPGRDWSGPPLRRIPDAGRLLVKRIAAGPGDPLPVGVPGRDPVPDGFVIVLGDGDSSYDSRHFGPVPLERVIGTAVDRGLYRAPL